MEPKRRQARTYRVATVRLSWMRLFLGIALVGHIGFWGAAPYAAPIRVALDDIPGIDMLNFLTAVEQAKRRGVDITVEYLRSEDIAVQAVLLGDADMGLGTPYAIIQKSDAPIRMIFQLNTLRFLPVVNKDYFRSWADLDGAEVFTHGRGSGTEAIMQLMARKHGIAYKSMQYLPGSGVRARAMLQGRIKASIVDTRRKELLLDQGENRFKFLAVPRVMASDEALYARTDFLDKNSAAVGILLEELLKVWRAINQDPEYVVRAWRRFKLLPAQASADGAEDIRRYYAQMVEVGAFPNDGGGLAAALADLKFYGFAGTLEGTVSAPQVNDYWDFEPLSRALSRIDQPK